jgi:hypothetical protein
MEIKKTTVTAKPQGTVLADGTFLSPRERMVIKKQYKEKKMSAKSLCIHYEICAEDMDAILGINSTGTKKE